MNEKFRTIGLDTEDKITEFIDYIDDLEDTEEIKSDVYGFFEEESSYNENHIPAYVVMTKYKGKYIVWVEDQCCDFAISYPPYNLCDIFSTYDEANEYYKSLAHSGIKPLSEQVEECKSQLIDEVDLRVSTMVPNVLGFFNLTDAETYTAARSYTLITCGLILFSYLNLTLTGLSTAQGDSRTPLLANFIGLAGNMILDPLLILGIGPFPRLEVAGAAIATVSSQILVFVVMVLRIQHSRLEPNVLQHLNLLSVFPKEYYKHIFRIGFPTAIQGSIYCFISMVLTRMVSGYGAAAIATQRVGGQIESVSWNTADGFASALNAFIAQNYGARKTDRIRKGYSLSFRVLTIWGLFVTAAFVFLPEPIARLFFHEKEALDTAVNYLVIIGFSEVFMSIELMTVGALSGLGRTRLSSTISVILTGSRIPLALILTHAGMGLNGVWWALTISSIVKGIVFTLTFQHISRRLPEKV